MSILILLWECINVLYCVVYTMSEIGLNTFVLLNGLIYRNIWEIKILKGIMCLFFDFVFSTGILKTRKKNNGFEKIVFQLSSDFKFLSSVLLFVLKCST